MVGAEMVSSVFCLSAHAQGEAADRFSTLIADSLAQQQMLVFQIQTLRRTRGLLLPRLLSGQIDVEATSQPAAEWY
ncbi:MAG: hypothetical protein Q8M09_02065 [Pseudomonadota bacterium]|nr:hypothetical protein [Pseudomonadota bacterium]MDP1903029.1 hypothetical protein [Pseudomonadota bacterium]MDP2352199.1 hypothetical protein [Pseudomonadota bacterium]